MTNRQLFAIIIAILSAPRGGALMAQEVEKAEQILNNAMGLGWKER